ncbi:hypothetical protein QEN19_001543 [Hanseniaspora menglaensis]
MSGRLPTLGGGNNEANNKPKSLKFKPKIVQRKTKEERDEALKQLEKEKLKQQEENDKKKRREDFFKQQQQQKLSGNRVPKYLQNTTLVSSGPLATGSSGSSSGGRGISSLIKNEHTELSLAQNGKDSDDDEELDARDEFNDDGEVKINMGKEYKLEDEKNNDSDADEEEVEGTENTDAKFELDHLFPVRPIKIKHEDLTSTNVKEEIKQNFSLPGTKENTPDIDLEDDGIPIIEKMQLDSIFFRNNPENNQQQITKEKQAICNDYLKINKKIHHKKTSKLIQKNLFLYQLPSILPFQNGDDEPLQGEIGKLRIHKSGKITMQFSNGTVMDVFKSAETSFLQDIVSINAPLKDSKQDTKKDIIKVKQEKRDQDSVMEADDEEESRDENDDIGMVEHLGTVTSKYVTVPRI